MRTIAEEMLSRINAEIKLLNYDNDITADDALHMVKFITPLYSQLRKLVSDYVFPTNEDEILFFKEIKPNILDKYLYFSKVYNIEMKCPIGNNEIIKEYLNQELEELTRFFRNNLDFTNTIGQNPLIWIAYISFARKRTFSYCLTVSNMTVTRCFQRNTIIRLRRYYVTKCCAYI